MLEKIEARPYGPDSTPAQIQAIKARIYPDNQNKEVIQWDEVPVMSTFQVDLFKEQILKLSEKHKKVYLLINLNEVRRPGPEVRASLNQLFLSNPKIEHVAVFTGKNFLINLAAKYVLKAANMKSFSIHKTRDKALMAIEKVKNEQKS